MSDRAEPTDLVGTFEDIARLLLAAPTQAETLSRIVNAAVAVIPGCKHAGISLIQNRTISTPSASDEIPIQVDAIEYETNQGPCLEAIEKHEVYLADDLTTETRWPDFSQRAAEETGIRSLLSFRLFVLEDTMGALNLYSP
ncbi:MAG: GAF domain-containing protein, partial [Actinobacteria bacterium]|nr:GAF domain-containing protein [Actinomycetota bacterium]